jgi:glucokinase
MQNNEAVSGKRIIGVDLGASYVRVGLFDMEGTVIDFQHQPLGKMKTAATGYEATVSLIEKVLEENQSPDIAGIGIGATGPVNPQEGTMISPYTEPAWQYIPITKPISDYFHVPCIIENDADTAALGEYWQGAGVDCKRLLAVTVGTGIGTAFLINGEIYRGLDGVHPEGGHHIIDPDGPECYCGVKGCWESLASGEAITAYAKQIALNNPQWMQQIGVSHIDEIDGGVVAKAAEEKNTIALDVMLREAYYLAIGLVNMIMIYAPEKIVLSGGVIKSYSLLKDTVHQVVYHENLMLPIEKVHIELAKLGYFTGVTGAAYALLQYLQRLNEYS